MKDDRKTAVPGAAHAEPDLRRIDHNQKIYADIVAKYYGDPDFKAKMDADPTRTLRAAGMLIPEGTTIKLLFNTENLAHLVLPAPLD